MCGMTWKRLSSVFGEFSFYVNINTLNPLNCHVSNSREKHQYPFEMEEINSSCHILNKVSKFTTLRLLNPKLRAQQERTKESQRERTKNN